MKNEREQAVRIASALKKFSAVLEVGAIIGVSVLLFFVTPVFFFAESVHASAPGLLGFLMKVFNTGNEAVTAKDVYCAFLPDFSRLFVSVFVLDTVKRFFGGVCKERKLFFPSAHMYIIRLAVCRLFYEGLPWMLGLIFPLAGKEPIAIMPFAVLMLAAFAFKYGEKLEEKAE